MMEVHGPFMEALTTPCNSRFMRMVSMSVVDFQICIAIATKFNCLKTSGYEIYYLYDDDEITNLTVACRHACHL